MKGSSRLMKIDKAFYQSSTPCCERSSTPTFWRVISTTTACLLNLQSIHLRGLPIRMTHGCLRVKGARCCGALSGFYCSWVGLSRCRIVWPHYRSWLVLVGWVVETTWALWFRSLEHAFSLTTAAKKLVVFDCLSCREVQALLHKGNLCRV